MRTVIDHNVVRDPGVTAVVVTQSAKARVASNVASGATGYAMFLVDDSNSHIVHNRLIASEHGLAIGGTRNVVQGNVVTNSRGRIDVFDGSTATRVEFNRLSRVGAGYTGDRRRLASPASETITPCITRSGRGTRTS